MSVPVVPADAVVHDRSGRPVHVGDQVRVEGVADLTQVAAADPRYGVVVVLVPGRVGKMGRMVRGQDIEVATDAAPQPGAAKAH
jgi:hypothetical protein